MKVWHVIVGLFVLELVCALLFWLIESLRARRKLGRELKFLPWAEADALLRREEGWQIAREEDGNDNLGMVWLERPVVR